MKLSLNVAPALELSFPETLERLWVQRHSGPVIVHFDQGRPKAVEIPSEPERIRLTTGASSAQT